jgi:hypothetical protein
MEKEFKHKNYKAFEEAEKVWSRDVQNLLSDFVVTYVEPKVAKDELIGIENAEEKLELDIKLRILAVGTKVTDVKAGDLVLFDPRMYQMSSIPTFLDDCLFWLTPSKGVIAILN